ncbi:hypothetical protein FOH24_07740 [Acetobacter tropicalis]|uniref:Uncharacterized protein n=1 Tax=Acetobacter tropicalis TaxID=104102 RepID=A0A094YIQ3_9PROT|nr:hypothetical protein [Acetobacter tropicalis]KAA8384046.1 hypothetical protein FOH22_15395 [Acetobacter tropicalis]KAA8391261.1 hypothetical protein FOH24_07740 [Acetobacter tropicalis]KGB21915.1 hypothetical protein AtDm6_2681 [Acetobacter tropicalis]MDO8173244.1 hypothetical protein [Acetobacter tropicalis]
MSHHEQRVCRGAVVLRGKWPVLVVAVRGALCAVVPLAAPCLPHHRADVPLAGCSAVRGHIARCGAPVLVRAGGLTSILGTVSTECLRRVDAALAAEHTARQLERLRPGVVSCALARGYRPGSKGRKIGGAPHAE